ncbi:MAG: hypothetical protein KGJ23_07870 [Euryarchaeota archaeon]|nr:hypothetical protein [Euryarchaeota archaeon]MDE1836517.1 hypothetical protein [Euryarchaeota archaeon]MDE1879288.1 hypothetical protein [Euryarchaeota archaeon]MDE2044487.1 hypothetical protein [Thermoplasmata archaeon]
MHSVRKNVSITAEQDAWLKEKCISLSRLVQAAIRNAMAEREGKRPWKKPTK